MATINTGQKEGGGLLCPFRGWSWIPVQHNVAWAEVYFHTKWRFHPSSRLATIDMGQNKLGGLCPFFLVELGPHQTQSRLG